MLQKFLSYFENNSYQLSKYTSNTKLSKTIHTKDTL